MTYKAQNDIIILSKGNKPKREKGEHMNMTDKQLQFISWLITTATDKCQTIEEVREMNKEIRKHSAGLTEAEKGAED